MSTGRSGQEAIVTRGMVDQGMITGPYSPRTLAGPVRPPHPGPVQPRRWSSTRRTTAMATSPPVRLLRRLLRHEPDDLDQAELPVDDVPLGLGHQGEPGGDAGRPTPAGRLRRDPPAGRPFDLRPRGLREREAWKRAVAGSDVRLQWDPDHGPSGNPSSDGRSSLGSGATSWPDTPRTGCSTSRTSPTSYSSSGRMRRPRTSGW